VPPPRIALDATGSGFGTLAAEALGGGPPLAPDPAPFRDISGSSCVPPREPSRELCFSSSLAFADAVPIE
jgi:hypothetical protein